MQGWYLLGLVGFVVMTGLAVISLNLLADPYALYRRSEPTLGVQGIDHFTRIVKPHYVARRQPALLLAGSSRAEYALDPDIAEQAFAQGPAFNMAISGINAYELARNIQHAVAVAPVRTLVVGLDFYMFNVHLPDQPGFDESRLAVTADGGSNWAYRWRDLPATLLSFDALQHSRQALDARAKALPCVDTWSIDGLRSADLYECVIARPRGQVRRFRQSLRAYVSSPTLYGGFVLDDRPLPSNSLANVATILDTGVETCVFYISPIHALQLLAIEQAGLWDAFEQWKRGFVTIVDRARRNGRDVRLIDFTRIAGINGAALDLASGTPSAAFYDGSHLRTEHNRRLIEALARPHADPWAIELTPGTLEPHLDELRHEMDAWKAAHPTEVVFLQEAELGVGE